jgi:hypothetical protein
MSQAGPLSGSSGPPAGEIEFDTDAASPAISAAGVIIFTGGSTSLSTAAGIQTSGSTGGNTMSVELTNRVTGTVTTTNATPTSLAIFALSPTPGVYNFDLSIAAFDVTDSAGAGWAIFGTVRSDGTDTFLVEAPDKITNQEAATLATDANLLAGGVGVNQAIVQVTGIAGKTINWKLVGTYVVVN